VTTYRYLATRLGAPYSKIAELHLSGVEWQRLRNGAGTFRAALKLPPPMTEQARAQCLAYKQATDRATTCVYVIRDGTPMAAYAIWGQDYDSADQQISISGSELTSYFGRRYAGDSADLDTRVSYEGVPLFDAVSDLLGRVNDVGLTLDIPAGGSMLPVMIPATNDTPQVDGPGWKGTDAKVVRDVLDEWASQDNGFDYRVDLQMVGSQFSRILVLRPTLGERVGVIAKFGSTAPKFTVRRRGDVRANDTIAVGGTDGPKRPYGRATSTAFAPVLQSVQQVNDEADTDRLDAAAQAALDAAQADEILEVDVTAATDSNPGAIFPGDHARFIVPPNRDPWFFAGLDVTIKTIGFTVRVPDAGGRETIGLQLVDETTSA
jgi:hypothetical protein